jgi:hypothetical protein
MAASTAFVLLQRFFAFMLLFAAFKLPEIADTAPATIPPIYFPLKYCEVNLTYKKKDSKFTDIKANGVRLDMGLGDIVVKFEDGAYECEFDEEDSNGVLPVDCNLGKVTASFPTKNILLDQFIAS